MEEVVGVTGSSCLVVVGRRSREEQQNAVVHEGHIGGGLPDYSRNIRAGIITNTMLGVRYYYDFCITYPKPYSNYQGPCSSSFATTHEPRRTDN